MLDYVEIRWVIMGILRVYLALCIVSVHTATDSVLPWSMHNGRAAVQIFFMISGFYMAMVLSNGYPSVKEFYISRFLRIFVPYYSVLLFVLVLSVVAGIFFNSWLELTPYVSQPLERNGTAGVVFAAASNITLFFQDWIMFLQHDRGTHLSATCNFWVNNSPLWQYLFIPQCWSVALELTFYLIVPYLNKARTRTLISICLCSLTARFLVYQFGLKNDPWNYRFFPFELAIFILGMISWRIYKNFDLDRRISHFTNNLSLFFLLALNLVVMFFHVKYIAVLAASLGNEFSTLSSYIFFVFYIPFLFALSKRSSLDRFIGELSYPVYLLHIIMISFAALLIRLLHIPQLYLGQLTAFLTIIASLLMLQLLLQPFEKWRHRFLDQLAAKRKAVEAVETA